MRTARLLPSLESIDSRPSVPPVAEKAFIKLFRHRWVRISLSIAFFVSVWICKNSADTPDGPFRVIIVDPPWAYNKRAEDPTHRGVTPYSGMAAEEIKALPVSNIAVEDTVLWLWQSAPHSNASLEHCPPSRAYREAISAI
jgi:hypothetical protein